MTPSIEFIRQILGETTNFVFPEEMYTLAEYAAQVNPPLVIVELGAYCGASTAVLASSSRVTVYSVDWHAVGDGDNFQFAPDDNARFVNTLVRYNLGARVNIINWDSQAFGKIFDKEIGLLFVDASHSSEAVQADLDAWLPHMAPHGVVAFHDYTAEQIKSVALDHPDLVYIQDVVMTGFFSYQPQGPKRFLDDKPFEEPESHVLADLAPASEVQWVEGEGAKPDILIELAKPPKATRKPAAKKTTRKKA